MNHISNHSTEPYYDIPLINDIHTHFPDLLYNIDRFESVRDVLLYVRSQVTARYDRFSNAEQRHNENINTFRLQQQQQQQQQQRSGGGGGGASARIRENISDQTHSIETPIRVPARIAHRTTATHAATQAAAPTLNDFATVPVYTTRFNLNDLYIPTTAFALPPPQQQTQTQTQQQQQQQDMDNATALLTLLGMIGPIGTMGQTPNLFEPITVRPSSEIIRATTTVETLQEDRSADDLCVICQEHFLNNEQIRRIRHCGHIFHNTCILQHFENSVRCPTCRHDIRDSTTTPTNL